MQIDARFLFTRSRFFLPFVASPGQWLTNDDIAKESG
jgi:hypothetical protein